MKRAFASLFLFTLLFALSSLPVLGQAYATVEGIVKDDKGQPIAGAELVWKNEDNGHNYKVKTDKNGHYLSLGLDIGKYTITTSKDGKVLNTDNHFQIGTGEVKYDVDLKQAEETTMAEEAKKSGLTPDQIKQQQEQNQKIQQYNAKVKDVNAKLKEAVALMQAQPPDYDKAIAMLNDIAQTVPNEDVIWGDLGAAYLDSAQTQTDPAEKAKRNLAAHDDLQKAIDLKKGPAPGQPAAGAPAGSAPSAPAKPATPEDNKRVAGYYANMGSASARLGKADEAAADFKQAAELDPEKAGNYYFNLGIVLHNSAKDADGKKQAVAAFDKAIAADPNKADAYYLKGTDLIALATTDSSGKLSAPDGTAEAFQKYLELQPNGPHAEESKQMLAALGSSVETGFGNKKTSTKKK